MVTTAAPGISSAKLKKFEIGEIPLWWPLLYRVLVEHPRGWENLTTLEAIYGVLLKGSMQAWGVIADGEIKLAALCYGELHVKRSSYVIIWCGGRDFKTYGPAGLRGIEDWARFNGFHDMSLNGRRGWLRLLRKYGYVEKLICLNKPLTPHVQGTC